jgi:hypothetical protein
MSAPPRFEFSNSIELESEESQLSGTELDQENSIHNEQSADEEEDVPEV